MAIQVSTNIKVRLIEVSYPSGSDIRPIFARAIQNGIFYRSIWIGPESALSDSGSPDRTFNAFLIAEAYADTILADLADMRHRFSARARTIVVTKPVTK